MVSDIVCLHSIILFETGFHCHVVFMSAYKAFSYCIIHCSREASINIQQERVVNENDGSLER